MFSTLEINVTGEKPTEELSNDLCYPGETSAIHLVHKKKKHCDKISHIIGTPIKLHPRYWLIICCMTNLCKKKQT